VTVDFEIIDLIEKSVARPEVRCHTSDLQTLDKLQEPLRIVQVTENATVTDAKHLPAIVKSGDILAQSGTSRSGEISTQC
jgi:hypothetical protein